MVKMRYLFFVLLTLMGSVQLSAQTTITPAPSDLWDNLETENVGSYYQSSPYARLIADTTATSVSVTWYVDTVYTSFNYCANLAVFVNGTYHGRINATGDGSNTVTYALPGGSIRVEIWSGCHTQNVPNRDRGAFLISAAFNASATLVSPVDTGAAKVLIFGDSITQSEAMNDSAVGFYGAWSILRRKGSGYGYRVQFDGAGGLGLQQCCNTSGKRDALITKWLTKFPDSAGNLIYIAIGTNDWAIPLQTKAAYQTMLGDFLDRVHTSYPNTVILVQSMLLTDTEPANSNGETPANFRTAVSDALSGRTWAIFVDGSAMLTVTSDGGATVNISGVHPTFYGSPKWGWDIAQKLYESLH